MQPPQLTDGKKGICSKENGGGEPASVGCYCTKLKCSRKILIINELLVEATGVELMRVLITRNLLILGTATTAKKAHCPIHCTFIVRKCFALLNPTNTTWRLVSHRFSGTDRKKHLASCDTVSHHLSNSSVHRVAVRLFPVCPSHGPNHSTRQARPSHLPLGNDGLIFSQRLVSCLMPPLHGRSWVSVLGLDQGRRRQRFLTP
jgi:hypothetical protein